MKKPKLIRVYKNLKAGGGVQSRLVEILPRLAEHFDVRMLCYRNKGERADEVESFGIPIDVIKIGSKWAPWNTRKYVEYFRTHAPDIVHAHQYTANTLGIFTARKAGVPVRIRHIHTMTPWGEASGIRARTRIKTDVWAALQASTTIAVSEAARSFWLERTAMSPLSCRVIYNGVDMEKYRNCEEAGQSVRREFNIPLDAPVVGCVGRLGKGKGHEFFLRAAEILSKKIPEVVFLMVGEGGQKQELKAMARSFEIGERTVFAGYRSDVPACLGAMDLFWFTSMQEGFGTALIEAQAAGLPVVSFDLPTAAEAMVDGLTGTIIPSGDEDALAVASLSYLSDRERAKAAGSEARKFAEKFSLDACVDQTLKLYDELLSRN